MPSCDQNDIRNAQFKMFFYFKIDDFLYYIRYLIELSIWMGESCYSYRVTMETACRVQIPAHLVVLTFTL